MPGKAAKISPSEKQLKILQQISRETTASVRLVQRARIVLLGFEGRRNEDIAAEVNLHRRQVGVWRRKWRCRVHGTLIRNCGTSTVPLSYLSISP